MALCSVGRDARVGRYISPPAVSARPFSRRKGFRSGWQSRGNSDSAAFDLTGVNLHTWTGWGPSHTGMRWLEMHGKGLVLRSSAQGSDQFPITAANPYPRSLMH